jgi:hypothetical protein
LEPEDDYRDILNEEKQYEYYQTGGKTRPNFSKTCRIEPEKNYDQGSIRKREDGSSVQPDFRHLIKHLTPLMSYLL